MQRVLRGVAAADGVALGFATVLHDVEPSVAPSNGGLHEGERALRALSLVAEDLERWSTSARREGRDEEAEILETSRLMAEDPVLRRRVEELAAEISAEAAVREATDEHARTLEALEDPELSARGADVRELGRRAVRLLNRSRVLSLPAHPTVVFARDVGPADVAEFRLVADRLLGVAVAEGTATSHAAMLTRSLGLPFVVGLGPEVLSIADGEQVCLDGDDGIVVIAPDEEVRRRAESAKRRADSFRRTIRGTRDLKPVTTDGRVVELLCNVNALGDVRNALAAGAQGVGLLRTELAFLESSEWPVEREHLAVLRPMLEPLADRKATVRTLDFGQDKTPPFLAGSEERGLALTLGAPHALVEQLRAILDAGRNTRLRIVFPLVRNAEEFGAAAALLTDTLEAARWIGPSPEVGAMIETCEGVEHVQEIAAMADFLALGTNDLVRDALLAGRRSDQVSAQAAADPRVLSLVARTVAAAKAAGVPVEVCGEAAGEAAVAVLLVGLGIDELSVTPARLDLVRWVVSSVSAHDAGLAAESALAAGSEEDALRVARDLLGRAEGVEEGREMRDGLGGVLP